MRNSEFLNQLKTTYEEHIWQLPKSSDANALNEEWNEFVDMIRDLSMNDIDAEDILCVSDVLKHHPHLVEMDTEVY